ncbi:hypothetical protein F5877DRAFT_90349 [Lentinula edodes]|nr:hypothetical protein F5877DRAFT_90349 [Lentinula edodes]
MPTPCATFAVNLTNSPGWQTPSTSRVGEQGPFLSRSRHEQGPGYEDEENLESHSGLSGSNDDSRWESRRKRLRIFLLSNPYVPLLFRLVNISFSTGTLAVAIQIRNWEKRYGLMGIVGSSPCVSLSFTHNHAPHRITSTSSHSTISWYNNLPRPIYNLPTVERSVGDVALICLVFASLVMYCTNLVISLY